MLGDISKAEKIYIACGYTDMRKSVDGFTVYLQIPIPARKEPLQNQIN